MSRTRRIVFLVVFAAALGYGLAVRDYEVVGFLLGAVAGIPLGRRLALVRLTDIPFIVVSGLLLVAGIALPAMALFLDLPDYLGIFLLGLCIITALQMFGRRYGRQLERNRSM